MTNNGKEALLRTILDKNNGTPGANEPTWQNIGNIQNNTYNKVAEETGYPNFNSPTRTYQYNNKTIAISFAGLYVYDNEMNLLVYYNKTSAGLSISIKDICIDNNNIYALIYYNNTYNLCYLNDFTMENADGEYELKIKKAYNITDIISNIIGWVPSSVFVDIKLDKCSYDSRYLISILDDNNSGKIIEILYNISVGTDNTYETRTLDLTTITNTRIYTDTNVTWTSDNCEFSLLVAPRAINSRTIGTGETILEITGDFTENSTLTAKTLVTIDTALVGGRRVSADNTPAAKYSNGSIIISYIEVNTTYFDTEIIDNVTWYKYKGTLYIKSISGETITNIESVEYPYIARTTQTTPTTGTMVRYRNDGNIISKNSELFIVEVSTNINETIDIYIKQIKGNSVINIEHLEDLSDSQSFTFGNVINNYNLWYLNIQNVNTLYQYVSVYKQNGYNGTPYADDSSIESESGILYNEDNIPIFARNLYDKILTGNTITSIIEIPPPYMNESRAEQEQLVSKTNLVTETDKQRISKNEYEQLYINWHETFRVYNNNDGSTYLQNPSYWLAEGIYNGFQNNYKINKFRVNYADGTSIDDNIENISIDGQEAEIIITLQALSDGAIKNIQIFDEYFQAPFCTIDMSNLKTGTWEITQHIRIE